MNLLFLSNLYPPADRGGYEQWCQEVAVELARRRHSVRVVTSRSSRKASVATEDGVEVHRVLQLEVEAGLLSTTWRLVARRERIEREDQRAVEAIIAQAAPDAVLNWGMWNVPRAVPATVEHLVPSRVAYYFCDYWPSLPNAYRQQLEQPSDRWLTRIPKRLLAWPTLAYVARRVEPTLALKRAICVSEAVRAGLVQSGVSAGQWQVIHGGVRTGDFECERVPREERCAPTLRLLYLGRLAPEKGVHTAIRALSLVADPRRVTLDLAGSGDHTYEAELRAIVRQLRLDAQVSFLGRVSKAELPHTFARYEALVFPSEWAEPLARAPMEALASGLVVIGTQTGGTNEILKNDVTGLSFAAGDALGLSAQIDRLLNNPALGERLARNGRQWVEARFSFVRMVDEIETLLGDIAEQSDE